MIISKATKYLKAILIVLSITIVSNCQSAYNEDEVKLAKVYDKYLYLCDVVDLIPPGTSSEDSIKILKNKTAIWVRKQLLLHQAKAGLTEEQKDVKKIVDDYRESLLINKYKQEYLKEKLDTVVTKAEIQDYYNNNKESFLLNRRIIKGYFLKIPLNNKKIEQIKATAIRTSTDLDLIKRIDPQNNYKIIEFIDKWQVLASYTDRMPNIIIHPSEQLKKQKYLISEDNKFCYFLKINEIKIEGESMPFEQAEENIKIILINKAKNESLSRLEKSAYENALSQGNLEIFIKQERSKKN